MFREFGTITSFSNVSPTPHVFLKKWYNAYFRIYVISDFGNIGDNLELNIYRF